VNTRFRRISVPALLAALLLVVLLATAVSADSLSIDFTGYTVGNINGQDGWLKTGPYDAAVVDQASLGLSYAGFGNRSLRISNAVTFGSFGDQTFSKPLVDEAGETGATNAGQSGGTRQPFFMAQWDFASTVPTAEQPGLYTVASPDRGDGARMSWVLMGDTPTGLEVRFNDYTSGTPGTCSGIFTETPIVTGLDRTVPHTIMITMLFVDGPANDVVEVYVDNVLVHTGTSWEDYFRDCAPYEPAPPPASESRTVDSVLFRVGGASAPATSGKGFLIDNLTIYSGPALCTTICYVDDAAGSDSNGGTSPADAFLTIQKGIDTVLPGGEVRVLPGTYPESPDVDKSMTLVSTMGRAVTTIDLQTGTNYTHSMLVTGAEVTIDGFTVEGIDAACPTLAATNIYVDSTTDNVVIKNNLIKVGTWDLACSTGDDGFGVITPYTAAPDIATLTVEDNIFEPLTAAGGTRAFYINPSVVDFTFRNNEINGLFNGTAMSEAQNNLIEGNSVTGTGASAGLGVWGYLDPTVWGRGTFEGNTITGTANAITLFDSEGVTVTKNVLDGNGTGVRVMPYVLASIDETTIHINNNALTNNTSFGINNLWTTLGDIDGTCNWWDAADGPGPVGSGSGDNVSAKVDFDPWLITSDLDSLCVQVDGYIVSSEASGVTDDAVAYGMEDLLQWDPATSTWSKWFDGSDAGLMPSGKNKHNIIGTYIPDPLADTFYMSFGQNARFVTGITGKVNGMDLVKWDGSAFSLYMDGEDVGLRQMTEEKIDAFHFLDASMWPYAGTCTDFILISTQGPGAVPLHSGGTLKFSGEDILGFCLINTGAATTGKWYKFLDGSDEGMPRNSLTGLSASDDGSTIFLTTRGAFAVDSASGGHSMVYAYDTGSMSFSGPYFNATAEGLPTRVDALDVDLP